MILFNKFTVPSDAPQPWGLYFQDSTSPQMKALIELHDNIMFYLAIILFGVARIMVSIIRNYVYNKSPISNKYINNSTLIELIWTITPALILILIAFPSFKLLYLMDEVTDPSLTVFVEGHQWHWSYQCPDFITDDVSDMDLTEHISGCAVSEERPFCDPCVSIKSYTNDYIIGECTHSWKRFTCSKSTEGVWCNFGSIHRPHTLENGRDTVKYFCKFCHGLICSNCKGD